MSVLSDLAVVAGAGAAVYGVNTWKRESQWKKKSALAEEALYSIYEVEEAISAIRSPMSWTHEEEGRERAESETEREAKARDRAHIVFSRIREHQDKLSQLRTMRQKCRVLFGEQYVVSFDKLLKVVKEVSVSAHMLGTHYWAQRPDWLAEEQRKLHKEEVREHECIIWALGDKHDKLSPKIEAAVAEAEQVFREMIEPPSLWKQLREGWGQFSVWLEASIGRKS